MSSAALSSHRPPPPPPHPHPTKQMPHSRNRWGLYMVKVRPVSVLHEHNTLYGFQAIFFAAPPSKYVKRARPGGQLPNTPIRRGPLNPPRKFPTSTFSFLTPAANAIAQRTPALHSFLGPNQPAQLQAAAWETIRPPLAPGDGGPGFLLHMAGA